MPEKTPDFWGGALLSLTMIAAWLGGEAGRIAVAGGAGGMLRWFAAEKRRLRDGIAAALGGALCAYFFWPLTLAALARATGQPMEGADAQAMAGCLTGVIGMSGVKIVVASFEAWALRRIASDGGSNG